MQRFTSSMRLSIKLTMKIFILLFIFSLRVCSLSVASPITGIRQAISAQVEQVPPNFKLHGDTVKKPTPKPRNLKVQKLSDDVKKKDDDEEIFAKLPALNTFYSGFKIIIKGLTKLVGS